MEPPVPESTGRAAPPCVPEAGPPARGGTPCPGVSPSPPVLPPGRALCAAGRLARAAPVPARALALPRAACTGQSPAAPAPLLLPPDVPCPHLVTIRSAPRQSPRHCLPSAPSLRGGGPVPPAPSPPAATAAHRGCGTGSHLPRASASPSPSQRELPAGGPQDYFSIITFWCTVIFSCNLISQELPPEPVFNLMDVDITLERLSY